MPRPVLPSNRLPHLESGSVEVLLGSIVDIVQYNVNKTRYECSLLVQEQLRRLREADFQAEAKKCQSVTLLLAQCKAKLSCLMTEIAAYPDATRDAWTPPVNELEARIESLRKTRKGIG